MARTIKFTKEGAQLKLQALMSAGDTVPAELKKALRLVQNNEFVAAERVVTALASTLRALADKVETAEHILNALNTK